MKLKTGKIAVMFIVSIMALAGTGAAYALWSETLTITGTATTTELDWEFYNPLWPVDPTLPPLFGNLDHGIDPFLTKDVGSNDAEFFDTDGDGDYDKMVLTITNAYPQYNDHIVFAVHCNGQLPLHIWKVVFKNMADQEVETLYANGDVYLDIDGDGDADIWITWGDNFGLQMHYCDWTDMSFNFYILQECPQGVPLTFTIEVVAGQYNEV